jgi:bifunctional NMN adenylyltransferase/nudix hydrolase
MKYDTLVFIGRFQPFHNAHLKILKESLKIAGRVILIIGSADKPRTLKNPWTFEERREMIKNSLLEHDHSLWLDSDLVVRDNTDSTYNDQAWAVRVQSLVHNVITCDGKFPKPNEKIGIVGHKKPGDTSTFYLDMFPQWEFVDSDPFENLDATSIRDIYFNERGNLNYLKGVVSESTIKFLKEWKETEHYKTLLEEKRFVEEYKKQFAGLAYPPTFVTADSVVIQSGHVLMIKRKACPGKGLWALPGGFLNAKTDRSLEAAALRELKEETGIKVPLPVLAGNIQDSKVFDSVDRSARGRTITQAFKIVLPNGPLPKVRGSDDAEKAKWIPISEIEPMMCFEDHAEILAHFLGLES